LLESDPYSVDLGWPALQQTSKQEERNTQFAAHRSDWSGSACSPRNIQYNGHDLGRELAFGFRFPLVKSKFAFPEFPAGDQQQARPLRAFALYPRYPRGNRAMGQFPVSPSRQNMSARTNQGYAFEAQRAFEFLETDAT